MTNFEKFKSELTFVDCVDFMRCNCRLCRAKELCEEKWKDMACSDVIKFWLESEVETV